MSVSRDQLLDSVMHYGMSRKRQLLLLSATVAVMVFGMYGLGLKADQQHAWTDMVWTLMSLLATARCFITARALEGSRRMAWIFFGFGCLSWFGGMLVWDYLELIRRQITPFPALSDIGYMMLAPFFMSGLLFYRNERPSTVLTLNGLANLGIIVTAIIICCIIIFFRPLNDPAVEFGYKLTALAYPVLMISVFLYALLVMVSRSWKGDWRIILLLTLSLAAHAVTDTLYAYTLLLGAYEVGNLLDIFWVAAFALVCWAGIEEQYHVNGSGISETRIREGVRNVEAMFPAVSLTAVLATVLLFQENLVHEAAPYLLPMAVLFILFLALSEWTIRRHEVALASEAGRSEARVRQLLDSTAEAIFGVDTGGRCTFANPACLRMLGITDEQDILGADMQGLLFGSRPELLADGIVDLDRLFFSNSEVYFPSVKLCRRDGGYLNAEIWSTPLREADGKAGAVVAFIDTTERHMAELMLVASEKELRNILSSMQDTYFRTDVENRLLRVSDSVVTLTGYTPDEIIGTNIADLYVQADPERAFVTALAGKGGQVRNHESLIRRKDGAPIWVSTNAHLIHDDAGNVVGMEGTARDVTVRKNSDAEMLKLSRALEQTADGVMVTNRSGIIEYVNPAYEIITGYSRAELTGKKSNVFRSGKQGEEFYRRMWQVITAGEVFSEVFINRRKDGALYYEAKTISPIKNDAGEITHFVATGKDITEQINTQERLQHMAHHDALTELPNRVLFMDRVKQSLARARWHRRNVAILFMDLDRFKNINDTLGHDVGDTLLKMIGERLRGGLREGDTVARFGGDEFVILLDDIATVADVSQVAGTIINILLPAFVINGQEFHITASIGISIYPDDGEDSQTLLKNADTAMYRAKDAGKNNYVFYSDEMSERAFEKLTLENSLRNAILRREFELLYQPQVEVITGRIIGCEALLRWRSPMYGLVSPADFIPMLEETGMIIPVGEWVFRSACQQMMRWRADGLRLPRLSVNISARQFSDKSFLPMLAACVGETGIDAALIELEMTESVLMRNNTETMQTVDSVHAAGFRIVIDDFGTGYSSLSYLKRFHVDMLKLDRSFVRDITHDPNDAALCSAIILLARSLNLDVIAEGVETREQLAFLSANGCHLVQGHLYSLALPASEIEPLLRMQHIRHAGAEEQYLDS